MLAKLADDAFINDNHREFGGDKVDGTYPKAGLPDPLLLTFYFTLRGDRITKLFVIGNNSAS